MQTLELATLGEPFGIKDRTGKVWKALPDLTAAEALGIRKMANATGDEDGFGMLEDMAKTVSRSMVRWHPAMTPEKVLDTFTPGELAQIVARFLVLSLRIASSAEPQTQTRKTTTGSTTTSKKAKKQF